MARRGPQGRLVTLRYRKRPVEIEAFQMTEERRQDMSEWPPWLHEAWNKRFWHVGAVYPETREAPEVAT